MRSIPLVAVGVLAAAVLLLGGASPGAGSSAGAIVRVDSVAVPAGGSAQVRVRVDPSPPGVGSIRVDVQYDSSHVEVTGCTPATCSIDVVAPDTVRLNNVSGLGLSGVIATLTLQAVGTSGQSSLSINPATLQVYTPQAEPVDGVEANDGVATILPTLTQGDVNCNGAITAADGLLILEAATGTGITPQAGCSPPGNLIDAFIWGDVNCDEALNALDALSVVVHASGAEPTQAPALCVPIGDPIS